jgi:hypothetical protein
MPPLARKIANAMKGWSRPTPEEQRRRILKFYGWSANRWSRLLTGLLFYAFIVGLAVLDGDTGTVVAIAILGIPMVMFFGWLAYKDALFRRDFMLEMNAMAPVDGQKQWRWTKGRVLALSHQAVPALLGTVLIGYTIYAWFGIFAALAFAALAVAYYVYLIRKWRGRKNRASSTDHANP